MKHGYFVYGWGCFDSKNQFPDDKSGQLKKWHAGTVFTLEDQVASREAVAGGLLKLPHKFTS